MNRSRDPVAVLFFRYKLAYYLPPELWVEEYHQDDYEFTDE